MGVAGKGKGELGLTEGFPGASWLHNSINLLKSLNGAVKRGELYDM